jgi:phosphatidylglycerophosphate synthase
MSRSIAMPAASHVRLNLGVLAAAEKRTLIWIASRLPAWVGSDHLSALGMVSMLAAGVSFAYIAVTPLAAAAVIVSLAANWFGDSLDGTVARVRNQQRPRYGFYVDHVIDIAGITFLMAGLAWSGIMSPLVAAAVLAAYLLVSSESFLATHSVGIFRMSFLGFGPTELRILLAAGALKAAQSPVVDVALLGQVRLFDLGGVVAIGGLAVAFVVSVARNTRALYLAEPLPAASERRAA